MATPGRRQNVANEASWEQWGATGSISLFDPKSNQRLVFQKI